jgi:hypothetical protein
MAHSARSIICNQIANHAKIKSKSEQAKTSETPKVKHPKVKTFESSKQAKSP